VATSIVLVVDSDPATIRRVEDALEGGRLDVVAAPTAADALRASAGKDIALVLCNSSLDEGDGYSAAGVLRDRHPAATTLLMTGGFEVFDSQRAVEAGISGCVAKPFSAQGLRARIEAEIGSLDSASSTRFEPTITQERLATILPRTPVAAPVVVDPSVVGPAMERAILAVLPEVVEAVIRQNIVASEPFRAAVEAATRQVVEERLEGIVSEVVREAGRGIETDGKS
jgi:CheY-like chemotaxis protein